MTRRDYTLVAQTIAHVAQHTSPEHLSTILGVSHALAYAFARDNTRFDPKRFLDACGNIKPTHKNPQRT